MDKADTIEYEISRLDEIIEWSLGQKSRGGYFATLYRRLTIAVKQGIEDNYFLYNRRMEPEDVVKKMNCLLHR